LRCCEAEDAATGRTPVGLRSEIGPKGFHSVFGDTDPVRSSLSLVILAVQLDLKEMPHLEPGVVLLLSN
jgi:hypothetical protein